MNISAEKLKELLVLPGHISAEDFDRVAKEAAELKTDIQEVLIEKGLIKDEQMGELFAETMDLQFVDLRKEKINQDVLSLIPESVARSKAVVAFAKTDKGIKVGMEDPRDIETLHSLEKHIGQPLVAYLITKHGLQEALSLYKTGLSEEFVRLIKEYRTPLLTNEARDEVVVAMVNVLLQYAYYNRASDIHLQPYPDKTLIRFRIDGVLHDMLSVPKVLFEPLLTRVKILSKMRTDEHRANQEGRMSFDTKEEEVDVRVSVVPVPEGENTVMRLLSAKSRGFSLGTLGLADRDSSALMRALKKPHGMILATGPTGCGKTTTIYAVLKVLHTREVHIATIEDPIEYEIEGITQIQVNAKVDLTFASGLRAIVRQDPDIIMVGEIRDEETSSIAVNAAMTGHLVLSTLHASNAPTTLTRLIDIGIEPFLVASTVNMVLAQRLVRKICEKCRASYPLTKKEERVIHDQPFLKKMFVQKTEGLEVIRLYKGVGCKACANTGLSGRVGIFEVLEISERIKELVLKRSSSSEIMNAAISEGMTTMIEDGLEKVLNGVTTLEEVFRVTQE